MKTFKNDPMIKEKYLYRLRAHAAADEIIQGTYWEDGKGCAVGCTIHGEDHYAYEQEICPAWLAFLEDDLFEAMDNEDAKAWPLRFMQAIPVGVEFAALDRGKSRLLH